MSTPFLIYTRSEEDWQRFCVQYPVWRQRAMHYPLLDIVPVAPDDTALKALGEADALVFTSHNAVATLRPYYQPASWQRCWAVGQRTAAALQQWLSGQSVQCAPPPYSSEALLSVWQPRGQRIALIAAPGGRTLLYEALSADNQVDVVAGYRRCCHRPPKVLRWPHRYHPVLMLSSVRALACLGEITPQKTLKLLQYRASVACISQRIAAHAEQAGFRRVFSTKQASEAALIAAIASWQPPSI